MCWTLRLNQWHVPLRLSHKHGALKAMPSGSANVGYHAFSEPCPTHDQTVTRDQRNIRTGARAPTSRAPTQPSKRDNPCPAPHPVWSRRRSPTLLLGRCARGSRPTSRPPAAAPSPARWTSLPSAEPSFPSLHATSLSHGCRNPLDGSQWTTQWTGEASKASAQDQRCGHAPPIPSHDHDSGSHGRTGCIGGVVVGWGGGGVE